MAEIADMMIGGEMCEGCGEYLDCNLCADRGIPAYCSIQCAKNRGASNEQVCKHSPMDIDPQVLGIMSAYGFVPSEQDDEQHKVRFQHEEGAGFIDVWWGKRGTTLGIYDRNTKSMHYVRRANVAKIEKALTEVTKDF